MMYWYGNGMSGWGYTLMTISMVLFWALLIAGVVAERFARGDIDDEEYQRRLRTLRGDEHLVAKS